MIWWLLIALLVFPLPRLLELAAHRCVLVFPIRHGATILLVCAQCGKEVGHG